MLKQNLQIFPSNKVVTENLVTLLFFLSLTLSIHRSFDFCIDRLKRNLLNLIIKRKILAQNIDESDRKDAFYRWQTLNISTLKLSSHWKCHTAATTSSTMHEKKTVCAKFTVNTLHSQKRISCHECSKITTAAPYWALSVSRYLPILLLNIFFSCYTVHCRWKQWTAPNSFRIGGNKSSHTVKNNNFVWTNVSLKKIFFFFPASFSEFRVSF